MHTTYWLHRDSLGATNNLVGLSLIMGQLTVKGPIKFTSAAVGWATAEFMMTR